MADWLELRTQDVRLAAEVYNCGGTMKIIDLRECAMHKHGLEYGEFMSSMDRLDSLGWFENGDDEGEATMFRVCLTTP